MDASSKNYLMVKGVLQAFMLDFKLGGKKTDWQLYVYAHST